MSYNDDGLEVISPEAWSRARRMGYGQVWDDRRYIPNQASNEWHGVVVDHPLIERERRA